MSRSRPPAPFPAHLPGVTADRDNRDGEKVEAPT